MSVVAVIGELAFLQQLLRNHHRGNIYLLIELQTAAYL